MKRPPAYFEEIRRNASVRWAQLEHDPELAAPWHQLFKQVQSPRHVLSELLQNADDAGATEAVVSMQDGFFIFAHNGEDFTEEHFRSLCRFGYSNKRSLHTIGFRGIGFKSTFSVGDEVMLVTPTLSVAFRRERFTEPVWLAHDQQPSRLTVIRVAIKDEHRHKELEKNLREWAQSPVSLLFFRSIRRLLIGEQEIHWESDGPGPVSDSEWMRLSTDSDRRYLLVRSEEESFPTEALGEIRQERMTTDAALSFPPCRVELVLGMEGRLFVVLPTGVRTSLPFACSAPFVQDPARVKIKDPEISPTNRWLLRRIGKLAATALLGWAGQLGLAMDERARAYDLWMDQGTTDNSLESNCAAIVKEAFGEVLKGTPCLLTEDGSLEGWHRCVSLPPQLLDIWPVEQVSALFDPRKRPVLSRHLTEATRQKLLHWEAVHDISLRQVVNTLKTVHPPRPKSWRQLLLLWATLASEVVRAHYWDRHTGVRIVPVNGSDLLHAGTEVVRLGDKQLLQSQEDWIFLAKYLLVMNPNWPRYLAEQRREAQEAGQPDLQMQVDAAYQVLRELDLQDSSDVGEVMAMVTDRFFGHGKPYRVDCIRLAHVAAKLGAPVPDKFQFITCDGCLTPVSGNLVLDQEHDLDLFVEKAWYDAHVIHPDYEQDFTSCSASEWRQWSASPRTGVFTFVPLQATKTRIWGKPQMLATLQKRGLKGALTSPYASTEFSLDDWDFPASVWAKWQQEAAGDPGYWVRVLARILRQPPAHWSKATSARAWQIAKNGHARSVTSEELVPGWVLRFRELPCLQDTYGRPCQPAELLRRTPETEPFLDVEAFVRREFDTEALRPLLSLLGVRDTPTGPGAIMERLRALAGVANPPVHEVHKWYHRLDLITDDCSTEQFQAVAEAFRSTGLVLTENQGWARSTEVFLHADEEDVPGAAVIHPAVRHLSLWRKLQINERPTADLAIAWLKSLPADRPLTPDEVRRVRSLLPRYPDRIWNECGHWLNLEGEWAPVAGLKYALTMQTLVPWKHLFAQVKQQVADFQKLPTDVCERQPFSTMERLGACIEERFLEKPGRLPAAEVKPWLTTLGQGLARVVLEDGAEVQSVRDLGRRLAQTVWQTATGLETVPYLDGTPAGSARRCDVLWRDCVLYVEDRSAAKMAAAVPQELGRVFNRSDIGDAIKLCYERSPEFVTEYLQTNFTLAPAEAMTPAEAPAAAEAQSEVMNGLGEVAATTPPVSPPVAGPESPADPPEAEVESPAVSGTARQPKVPRPVQPNLIEQFAATHGFALRGPQRFERADGSWIARGNDSPFPWEHYGTNGELVQRYWVKDHCIEREPLELDAALWLLCDQFPDRYTIILATADGNPVAISGRRLLALRDQGYLALHPATYRLVYRV